MSPAFRVYFQLCQAGKNPVGTQWQAVEANAGRVGKSVTHGGGDRE